MTARTIRYEIERKTTQLFPKASDDIREMIVTAMIQGALIALAILFAFSISAEVIQLGTICQGTGIDIIYPDRSDIVSLEITFLKPGAGMTNVSTITTTNRLIQLADLPAELPDGRTILGMRWILLGGLKSEFRMATMDLYRNPPDAPIAKPTFVSTLNFWVRDETRDYRGSAADREKSSSGVDQTPTSPHPETNDAPVRAWHGAMTDHSVESNTMVDPELSRAVAEQFRKPTDSPPPLPPATNGMQRAYQPTEAQKAMLKFFKDGGQKGRP